MDRHSNPISAPSLGSRASLRAFKKRAGCPRSDWAESGAAIDKLSCDSHKGEGKFNCCEELYQRFAIPGTSGAQLDIIHAAHPAAALLQHRLAGEERGGVAVGAEAEQNDVEQRPLGQPLGAVEGLQRALVRGGAKAICDLRSATNCKAERS